MSDDNDREKQAELEQELEKLRSERSKKEKNKAAIEAADRIMAILEPLDYEQSKRAIRLALASMVSSHVNVILEFKDDYQP